MTTHNGSASDVLPLLVYRCDRIEGEPAKGCQFVPYNSLGKLFVRIMELNKIK